MVTGARIAAGRLSSDGKVDAANAVFELVGAYRWQERLIDALRREVDPEVFRAAQRRADRGTP